MVDSVARFRAGVRVLPDLPSTGTGNIRAEGIMKVGKGQTIEAYFNQKIRAEETGYHLQRDNERLGRVPPKGPEIPQPAPRPAQAEVREISGEEFELSGVRHQHDHPRQ